MKIDRMAEAEAVKKAVTQAAIETAKVGSIGHDRSY